MQERQRSNQTIQIIGIDCATDSERIGLVNATFASSSLVLNAVQHGKGKTISNAADIVAQWVDKHMPTLLSIDAPLGWPDATGRALVSHEAGRRLNVKANQMFRRLTDEDIFNRFHKRPLEVGAKFISRTAVAALELVGEVEEKSGRGFPLAWYGEELRDGATIEVYPAATLKAYSLDAKNYKKEYAQRVSILRSLKSHLELACAVDAVLANDHCFDAALCALAAADFLRGDAVSPDESSLSVNRDVAKKEGWIWVRKALPT